jgi:hypothetical protein
MLFRGMTVVAALTLLAACSSDADPVEPDPSPTATASSTPTIPVPTMPAQASEDSPEGAAAFVKHYVDVFNYGARTGQVDSMKNVISPDCAPCTAYADDFETLDPHRRPTSNDPWKPSKFSVQRDEQSTQVTTTVEVLNDPKSPYRLTFVLPATPPYAVVNIIDREK